MMEKSPRIGQAKGGVWHRYGHLFLLAGIAVLSFLFNFYAVSKTGYGNSYYAAAVKSMSQSFHNFFYVSFDPAGMVSVDKPPVGLWVQTLFVLVFGYHGWALLLPQALAGTASCLMLYVLTAKRFGRPAGLIASLVFALTPAVVVASRNNTMDMQLILVLLAATWFLFRAIDTGKWRWLFTAAALIGLGFNVKMLQAYLILPAVAVAYLVFSKEKPVRRLIAAGISLVILAGVSFSWAVAVDLTPAADRPYVGSSTNNTVWELIIGHNGLERLTGQSTGTGGQTGNMPQGGGQNQGTQGGMPGNFIGGTQSGTSSGTSSDSAAQGGTAQTASGSDDGQNMRQNGGGFGQGGMQNTSGSGQTGGFSRGSISGGFTGGGIGGDEIGTASPVRLWTSNLFGQITWLLPMALFAVLASLKRFRYKERTGKQAQFVYWVLWLGVMAGFFSFAGFYHRYYLCMMAPGIAVLTGIGVTGMVRAFRDRTGWKQVLLPVSVAATLVPAVLHVWNYAQVRTWLVPLMAGAGAAALIAMGIHRFTGRRAALAAAGVLTAVSLLAAPVYWSFTAVIGTPNSTLPYAGPELLSQSNSGGQNARGGMPSGNGFSFGGGTDGTSSSGSASSNSGTSSGSSSSSSGSASSSGSSSSSSSASYASLQAYLVAHYKTGSYLVVAQRTSEVDELIINTGLPAVAYGGFLGSDNAMTVSQLKKLVAEGKVTYFLLSSQGGFGGASQSSDGTESGSDDESSISAYVQANATKVDSSAYGGESQNGTLYVFGS